MRHQIRHDHDLSLAFVQVQETPSSSFPQIYFLVGKVTTCSESDDVIENPDDARPSRSREPTKTGTQQLGTVFVLVLSLSFCEEWWSQGWRKHDNAQDI
mmetsp:Transcript_32866/g.75678  ORF Transcript_32866/g.75678 Transcript_32866/m.75678 type:complete len:99 (+) Transcript_32866:1535-1831(+)